MVPDVYFCYVDDTFYRFGCETSLQIFSRSVLLEFPSQSARDHSYFDP